MRHAYFKGQSGNYQELCGPGNDLATLASSGMDTLLFGIATTAATAIHNEYQKPHDYGKPAALERFDHERRRRSFLEERTW